MEQNHCGHLGLPIHTILADFDPEVSAQSNQTFGKRCRKLTFKMAAVAAIMGLLSAHLTILCLLSALMFIIKFRFKWIIEEMSKI